MSNCMWLFCLISTLYIREVLTAQMIIQPPVVNLRTGSQSPEVTMTCTLSTNETTAIIQSINLVRIARNRVVDHRSYFVNIAMMIAGMQAAVVGQDTDIKDRSLAVNGTIQVGGSSHPHQAELTLVWPAGTIQSMDEGQYQCEISYLDTSFHNHIVHSLATLHVNATEPWGVWSDWHCLYTPQGVCFMQRDRNCSTGRRDVCGDGHTYEVRICGHHCQTTKPWGVWSDWHCLYTPQGVCFMQRDRNCSTGRRDVCGDGHTYEVRICGHHCQTTTTSTATPLPSTAVPVTTTPRQATTVHCLACNNTPTNLAGCKIVNCNPHTEWCFVVSSGGVVNAGCRSKLLCQAPMAVGKKRNDFIGHSLSRDAVTCSKCCDPTSQCLCNIRVDSCRFSNFDAIPYVISAQCA